MNNNEIIWRDFLISFLYNCSRNIEFHSNWISENSKNEK